MIFGDSRAMFESQNGSRGGLLQLTKNPRPIPAPKHYSCDLNRRIPGSKFLQIEQSRAVNFLAILLDTRTILLDTPCRVELAVNH